MRKLTLEERITRLEKLVCKSTKNESANLANDVFRWYANNVDMYNFSRVYDYVDYLDSLATYHNNEAVFNCMKDLGYDTDDQWLFDEVGDNLAELAAKDIKRAKSLPRVLPRR